MWSLFIAITVLLFFTKWIISFFHTQTLKNSIPGPSIWESLKLVIDPPDPYKSHVNVVKLSHKYGSVFKIPQIDTVRIMATDYDSIYEILITAGKKYGGRPTSFRLKTALKNTGILSSHQPDATWKELRKASQRHLRQFGDGLSRLESVIIEVADDMFDDFRTKGEKPCDPKQIVFDTALKSIAFLMTGEPTKCSDPLIEKMRRYENLFLTLLPGFTPLSYKFLDVFPWIRYFGLKTWKLFEEFLQLEADIWKSVLDKNQSNPNSQSICKVLQTHMNQSDGKITETDSKLTTLSLLFAGVTTTSGSFYAALNILAHNKNVQQNIWDEVVKIEKEKQQHVGLSDRPNMPYTRSFILELLRYVTIVPNGVPHRTCTDVSLNGYTIPSDTTVLTSLWALHHEEAFWKDPFCFRPERFLDEYGEMVPADHPNRKHLMPFGAGLRVCLGESLALSRLWLWTVSLIHNFEIIPAKGNEKWTTDPRLFRSEGVLRPTRYQVIFQERK